MGATKPLVRKQGAKCGHNLRLPAILSVQESRTFVPPCRELFEAIRNQRNPVRLRCSRAAGGKRYGKTAPGGRIHHRSICASPAHYGAGRASSRILQRGRTQVSLPLPASPRENPLHHARRVTTQSLTPLCTLLVEP